MWVLIIIFVLISYSICFSATLGETLVRHRSKPRVYIGCMKSGPVLNQKWELFSFIIVLFNESCKFVILSLLVSYLPTFLQRGKVPWTRILEIWRGWKQVLPSCHRTVVCHFKRSGFIYFNQPVSPSSSHLWWIKKNWNQIYELNGANIMFLSIMTYVYIFVTGMFFTSMPMRMSH